MTAVYLLLTLALVVVCTVVGLVVGLSWGSRTAEIQAPVHPLASFLPVFESSPLGYGVVSCGNPEGDGCWGWTGPQQAGRWLHTNRALTGLLGGDSNSALTDLTLSDTLHPPPEDGDIILGTVRRQHTYDEHAAAPASYTLTAVYGDDGAPLYAVVVAVSRSSETRAEAKAAATVARLEAEVEILQERLEITRSTQTSTTRRSISQTMQRLESVADAAEDESTEEGSDSGR